MEHREMCSEEPMKTDFSSMIPPARITEKQEGQTRAQNGRQRGEKWQYSIHDWWGKYNVKVTMRMNYLLCGIFLPQSCKYVQRRSGSEAFIQSPFLAALTFTVLPKVKRIVTTPGNEEPLIQGTRGERQQIKFSERALRKDTWPSKRASYSEEITSLSVCVCVYCGAPANWLPQSAKLKMKGEKKDCSLVGKIKQSRKALWGKKKKKKEDTSSLC